MKKPKYKKGDLVYSYQNKTIKAPVWRVRESKEEGYDHAYQLTLPHPIGGGTVSSKWIDEGSISRKKLA